MRERKRGRGGDRGTETNTDRQWGREREIERERDRQTDRDRDIERERETLKERERQRETERGLQTGRKTDTSFLPPCPAPPSPSSCVQHQTANACYSSGTRYLLSRRSCSLFVVFQHDRVVRDCLDTSGSLSWLSVRKDRKGRKRWGRERRGNGETDRDRDR